jgi:hypothetical protein
MKAFFILAAIYFGTPCFAVNPSEIPEYTHQGNLVTIRVVPKDRSAKIFIVGHKAAEMNFKDDAQILSVSVLKKNRKETLQLNRQGDFYEVQGLPEGEKPYQLMIKAAVKGQTEEVKVNIPTQKP